MNKDVKTNSHPRRIGCDAKGQINRHRALPLVFASFMLLAACGQQTQTIEVVTPAPIKTDIIGAEATKAEDTPNADNQTLGETDLAEKSTAPIEAGQDDNGTDMVGDIIWQLEQIDKSQPTATADSQDVLSFEELIPTGPDPSLAEEALDAAFAMLKRPEDVPLVPVYSMAAKAEGQMRIGVFLPNSGPHKALGMQIDKGLQMAYFQIGNPQIELIYFDSAGTDGMDELAASAIAAEIDIAVGPLFSDKAAAMLPILRSANIPILSFSNNQKIASSGLWVLGLLPEQQMDMLLGQALSQGYEDIAILADRSLFGQRMSEHILNRLTAFGMSPNAYQPIDGAAASDDEMLISQIKSFARYVPLEEGELIDDRPPPYEAVILAGGPDFILKVAPLLAYYDLGPDRVAYLGTDLWANPALSGEPSLQNAYIASIAPSLSSAFSQRHQDLYQSQSSLLGQLGFDVMAVAAQALSQRQDDLDSLQTPLIASLLQEQGFKGYTGAFKLAANGLNYRDYTLYQLVDGALEPATIPPVPIYEPKFLGE